MIRKLAFLGTSIICDDNTYKNGPLEAIQTHLIFNAEHNKLFDITGETSQYDAVYFCISDDYCKLIQKDLIIRIKDIGGFSVLLRKIYDDMYV